MFARPKLGEGKSSLDPRLLGSQPLSAVSLLCRMIMEILSMDDHWDTQVPYTLVEANANGKKSPPGIKEMNYALQQFKNCYAADAFLKRPEVARKFLKDLKPIAASHSKQKGLGFFTQLNWETRAFYSLLNYVNPNQVTELDLTAAQRIYDSAARVQHRQKNVAPQAK